MHQILTNEIFVTQVYTVNDESRHLLIHNVPAIAVTAELEALCQRFGSLEHLKRLADYPTDKFCEVYYAKFHAVQSARFAKIHIDDRSFFGGVLHVCYAPELETLQDTRDKLAARKREILQRLAYPTKRFQPMGEKPHCDDSCQSSSRWQPVGTTSEPAAAVKAVSVSTQPAPVAAARGGSGAENFSGRQKPTPTNRIVYHQRNKKEGQLNIQPLTKKTRKTD